jgi:hypothetical protein
VSLLQYLGLRVVDDDGEYLILWEWVLHYELNELGLPWYNLHSLLSSHRLFEYLIEEVVLIGFSQHLNLLQRVEFVPFVRMGIIE